MGKLCRYFANDCPYVSEKEARVLAKLVEKKERKEREEVRNQNIEAANSYI